MKHILISANGGDRATAYTMSNKIVLLPEGYLVTWIDDQRQNQWAIVDLANGSVLQSGPLGGPCIDNHCGAALVLADDHVHAITGGHHSPFQHYRMVLSRPGEWQQISTVNVKGTYPSIAADSRGRIHLSFRSPGDRFSLDYCRFQDGFWTPPRRLVIADKPGYIYWTNGLAVGPNDALHLVFGNTRVREDQSLLYGASHIVSRDAGETWCDDNGDVLPQSSSVLAIPLMMDENRSERVQSLTEQREHDQPGPRNLGYQQIILSNPVVAPSGVVHVVLHNGLTGTADLMSRYGSGTWTATSLTSAATHGDPIRRIHVQSSLCILPNGRPRVALMVEPTPECVWGAPGTSIVLAELREDGTCSRSVQVTPSDPEYATWLPSQPHQVVASRGCMPPLLYTKGVNAGGFANNKNTVKTEVFFCEV